MRKIIDFNYDWQFFSEWKTGMAGTRFADEGEAVSIPHTPRIEAHDVTKPFMGVMGYRKVFRIPSELLGKRLFVDFEGVMSKAEVYINGKKLKTHYGGYLPFSVDITTYTKANVNNTLVVKVTNKDNPNIPPGKPTDKVDFLYFGGIYRNVKLRAVDKVYIDEAVGKKSNAGIFVYTEKIADTSATLNVNVYVKNSYFKKSRVVVKYGLYNNDGVKVANISSRSEIIGENKSRLFNAKLFVNNPHLWSCDEPYLYTLECTVTANDELVDCVRVRTGIRTVEVNGEGFLLNGKLLRLNGANRHQQFPYIGIAGSEEADYRDIYKLKEAGFNTIRLSHYPQSDAVMDACDELGIIAIVPVPGWQHCALGVFRKRVLENIRDMVRRDRNHPSACIWETSLNETGSYLMGASDAFFRKCVEVARKEFLPFGMLTCGDTLGRRNWKKIGYDIPFTGWDNATKTRPLQGAKKGLTREYGDYEFGGHNSTTRARIGDGEWAMRVQAFNFQWSHNMNLGSTAELGDLIWEGIDHNRGMGKDKPVSTSGILNEFRLPKFAYYFYMSQRDDKDVTFISSLWTRKFNDKVTVYSNADEVELIVNGVSAGRQKHNAGDDCLYTRGSASEEESDSVDYWQNGQDYNMSNKDFALARYVMNRIDNGGACNNLKYPPFTFNNVAFVPGKIEAIGYRKGRIVSKHTVCTPESLSDIRMEADYSGKYLVNDGRDFVFVRACLEDAEGNVITSCGEKVTFSIEGGEILGPKRINAEAGIASVMVKSLRGADKTVVHASCGKLTKSLDIILDNSVSERA